MYTTLGAVAPGGRNCLGACVSQFPYAPGHRATCVGACQAAADQTQCDTYCFPAFSASGNQNKCVTACTNSFSASTGSASYGGSSSTGVIPGYHPLPVSPDGTTPPPGGGSPGGSFTDNIPFWPWSGVAAAAALFLWWRSR